MHEPRYEPKFIEKEVYAVRSAQRTGQCLFYGKVHKQPEQPSEGFAGADAVFDEEAPSTALPDGLAYGEISRVSKTAYENIPQDLGE